MSEILMLLSSLWPAVLVLFVVGYMIYIGTKHSNYSKSTKTFTTIFYLVFSFAFIGATIGSSYGDDKASIIAFSVVGGLILLPIIVSLIAPPFKKEEEKNVNAIIAKLVDYSPASLRDESKGAKNKYNAVFMHIAQETKYYTSYEVFDEEELKSKLNDYVEINIDNDRCSIIDNLTKSYKRRKEKEKDVLSGVQFAAHLITRVPFIIGLIIIDIIFFSRLNFIYYCLLIVITLFAIYDFVKKLIVLVDFHKHITKK